MKSPLHKVSPGKNAPNKINVIIEIPKNSRIKYEEDESTGLIRLDRVLPSEFRFPIDYGLIPQTLAEDNDPIDVIVITNLDLFQNTLLEVRPIGVMELYDQGKRDDKILAIPVKDLEMKSIKKIKQLDKTLLNKIKLFFNHYKDFENKKTKVLGFKDKDKALKIIKKAISNYKKSNKRNTNHKESNKRNTNHKESNKRNTNHKESNKRNTNHSQIKRTLISKL